MININFIGRLGADAELKTSTKNGKQFVTMRVATDEFKNGENTTAWINVTYTAERAIKMHEYLKKGSAVSVHGIETVGTYQNKNGETMVSRDVLADRVDFLGLGKSGDTQSNESAVAKTEEMAAASAASKVEADDLPF